MIREHPFMNEPIAIDGVRDGGARSPRRRNEYTIRWIESGQSRDVRKISKISGLRIFRHINTFDAGRRAVQDHLVEKVADAWCR